MKLITASGIIAKARRFLSSQGSVDNAEALDPDQLAKTLRLMSNRLSELEARVGPEAVDFEVNVGTGGAVTTILHSFSSPVRWWVVTWMQTGGIAYATEPPILVQDASSTPDRLSLRSYRRGRAIVRVEPATSSIDPGITVLASPSPANIALAAQFDTTSLTEVSTGLSFPVSAGEEWALCFYGIASSSTAAGLKYAIGAPVGSTVNGVHQTNTTGINVRVYGIINAINTLGAAIHTVANTATDDQIYATVKAAIGGTVSIDMAKVTGGTASLAAKSTLIATKVTEV